MAKRIWLPSLLVVVVFSVTVIFCGANFFTFFDLPSLILVPIAPFLFMILSYGWKGTREAFTAPFKAGSTKRELGLSASFFKSFGNAIWCFGALGSTSGLITVLAYLTDKTKVGPNSAIALITMLYAAIFNAALTLPFLALARRKLADIDDTKRD
ncbi:MAG: hypothetical protein A2Y38_08615 [Spirochaetes bacterium GWB1_59_5]|nr:MAG: hypothetical protein A2Y38_08615 [Spirochaetes bacterium GWB1_59_5]